MSLNTNLVLPIAAAILWGLHYALAERVLRTVNVPTWMLLAAVSMALVAFGMSYGRGEPLQFSALLDWRFLVLVALTLAAEKLAYLATAFGIVRVSATYAAIGEVSYPLFVPFFAWLLFGTRNWNWTILLGGVLILLGVYTVILGQSRLESEPVPDASVKEQTNANL